MGVPNGGQAERQGGSGGQERNHDKAATADKSEIMKGDNLGDGAAVAAESEIIKGDKVGRQGGSGSKERNHEGRQAWDKAAAVAKSEIMKGDKLGRQGSSGSQFPQSGTQPLRSKNPYSFQLSGEKHHSSKTSCAHSRPKFLQGSITQNFHDNGANKLGDN